MFYIFQVNAKLNGLNHRIDNNCMSSIQKQNIMIVGADVTHPGPGSQEPSVVGVAATHDVDSFKYNIVYRIQPGAQEMITDLAAIMVEMLNYFKSKRTKLPEHIMYYRDGVSDGQFQEVLNKELLAIYKACQQVANNYKPKVSFLVVMKRHHTRFFPLGKFSEGRNNNVKPGTIVDKYITSPKHCQFFLVAHASIQGVAKPTRYCLLHDDSGINIDELQKLTNHLCYLFTRCNRTVSYVAPTYYAHHAAARGKVYIQGEKINSSKLDMEFQKRQIRPEIRDQFPMFFV